MHHSKLTNQGPTAIGGGWGSENCSTRWGKARNLLAMSGKKGNPGRSNWLGQFVERKATLDSVVHGTEVASAT